MFIKKDYKSIIDFFKTGFIDSQQWLASFNCVLWYGITDEPKQRCKKMLNLLRDESQLQQFTLEFKILWSYFCPDKILLEIEDDPIDDPILYWLVNNYLSSFRQLKESLLSYHKKILLSVALNLDTKLDIILLFCKDRIIGLNERVELFLSYFKN